MCNIKGVNIFLNSFLENNLPPLFLGLVVMTVIFCISSAFFNLLERACCHIFFKIQRQIYFLCAVFSCDSFKCLFEFCTWAQNVFVCYCCFSCVTLVSNPNYPFKLNHNKV